LFSVVSDSAMSRMVLMSICLVCWRLWSVLFMRKFVMFSFCEYILWESGIVKFLFVRSCVVFCSVPLVMSEDCVLG